MYIKLHFLQIFLHQYAALVQYTYTVTNYKGKGECIVADMLVCEGKLIGGDICNPSAKDGFLVGFEKNE